jgi:hypothetical protein
MVLVQQMPMAPASTACVGQRHAAQAVLARQGQRPVHAHHRVQVAGPAAAVPALHRAPAADPLGPRPGIDDALPDLLDEARKPVQPVAIHAVAAGLGEQAGALPCVIDVKAQLFQHLGQAILDVLIRNTRHEPT